MKAIDDTTCKRGTFLVLRLFFIQFWLLQFFGKLHNADTHAMGLGTILDWSARTTDWFVKTSPLPSFAVAPYTYAIPWIELALGICILLGFRTRIAFLLAALYLVSLDVGLMFQLKHDVVGTNTITMLASLLAAWLAPYDAFSVDKGFAWPKDAAAS